MKLIAETVAGLLVDKLAPQKVDAGELARVLSETLNATGMEPIAGQLLPDLRKVVDDAAKKFANLSDTLALAEKLSECVAELVKLKGLGSKQDAEERAKDQAKQDELGKG